MSIVSPDPDSKTDRLRDLNGQLRALRVEAEALASTLASVDLPASPTEVTEDGQRVWYDSRFARVHVIENCVFISGRQFWMTWPNWTALRPSEARQLGVALLAAAADLRPELELADGGEV